MSLRNIIDDAKGAYAFVETKISAIESPALRLAAVAFFALLVLMLVWAVLPWIGLLLAIGVVALIVRAFMPPSGT